MVTQYCSECTNWWTTVPFHGQSHAKDIGLSLFKRVVASKLKVNWKSMWKSIMEQWTCILLFRALKLLKKVMTDELQGHGSMTQTWTDWEHPLGRSWCSFWTRKLQRKDFNWSGIKVSMMVTACSVAIYTAKARRRKNWTQTASFG